VQEVALKKESIVVRRVGVPAIMVVELVALANLSAER
jgi:hypothetical protein